jgi:hypothetical protein
MEQQMNTKFCFKLDKTPIETHEILQTNCGDEVLSRSNVSKCFKLFQDGRDNLQEDPRSGRPSTSRNSDTIANVREMVTRDLRWPLRMMADELNINKEKIRQILHEDLRRGKIRAKFIPHRLRDREKQQRLTSCQGFIQTGQGNPSFLDSITFLLT